MTDIITTPGSASSISETTTGGAYGNGAVPDFASCSYPKTTHIVYISPLTFCLLAIIPVVYPALAFCLVQSPALLGPLVSLLLHPSLLSHATSWTGRCYKITKATNCAHHVSLRFSGLFLVSLQPFHLQVCIITNISEVKIVSESKLP